MLASRYSELGPMCRKQLLCWGNLGFNGQDRWHGDAKRSTLDPRWRCIATLPTANSLPFTSKVKKMLTDCLDHVGSLRQLQNVADHEWGRKAIPGEERTCRVALCTMSHACARHACTAQAGRWRLRPFGLSPVSTSGAEDMSERCTVPD